MAQVPLHLTELLRELSHYYVADKHGVLEHLPSLAAQHLLDGFALEVLDGTAGLLNRAWLQDVLKEVELKLEQLKPGSTRVRVVSILGAQSSGKRSDL